MSHLVRLWEYVTKVTKATRADTAQTMGKS